MLGTLSGWFIEIYDSMYTSSSPYDTLLKFDQLYDSAVSEPAFELISASILSAGTALMLIYFFADLADKLGNENFSLDQLFRSLLKIFIAVALINNGIKLVGYIVDLGAAIAADMTTVTELSDETTTYTSLTEFFSEETYLTAFKNGLNKIGNDKAVIYIVEAIIPYILALVTNVLLVFIGMSRIVELVVRTIFAPLAVADMFQQGSRSAGERYLKKIMALALQFAAIVGIFIVCSSIMSSTGIATDGSEILTNFMNSADLELEVSYESNKFFFLLPPTAVVNPTFSKDSCISFLDALFGDADHYWLCLGVMFARIGLAMKSQKLVNDVVGV